MKNLKKFIIPAVVVIVALAVAGGLYSISGAKSISKDKAGKIALKYINEEILQGQGTASLVNVFAESGVYKVQLKIESQEYSSYITKDGKILFPQGYELAPEENNSEITKTDKPIAQLFVMSFCPYGNQAEELMMEVTDLLRDKADIQLHYVIYDNYQGGGSDYCMTSDKYCSMHGIQELNQDVRELCVQKYQQDKFWDFVKQINASCTSQNVDTCWTGVASKTGIDTNKIKACQADEAVALLESEVELGKQYNISGSPQFIINGTEYTGNRTADGYKSAICSGFKSEPSECEQALSTEGGTTSGGCE